MTPLEAVLKIKAMLAAASAEFAPADPAMPAEPAPAVEPAAAAPTEAAKEYDLKAGGKVLIDKLEIGGMVTMIDDAGNQAPAPAGEHELVDGTIINVDENGAIAEISSAAEEKTDVVEEVIPADPAPVDMTSERIAKLEADIAELKKALDSKTAAMQASESKFSQAITDLSDVIVGLINTPSANATENPKDKFNAHVENKEAKMKRFLELAKSINK